MHFHKGPAVEPLALEKFDVRDIDEPSSLYPELNFIVDHCRLPRLDDFCWMSARSPNIYASLAVAHTFLGNRPREFGKVMANLLFWLGPDRIVWGTDFPIWYPHWQLDRFKAFELPEDLQDEYGVELTDEIKQKILGGNIARLYDIDIEAKLKQIKDDEFGASAAGEHLARRAGRSRSASPDAAQPAADTASPGWSRGDGRRRAGAAGGRSGPTRRCGARSPSWIWSTRWR